MKILYEQWGQTERLSLLEFVRRGFEAGDTSEIFCRLLESLVENETLKANDVFYIVKGYSEPALLENESHD